MTNIIRRTAGDKSKGFDTQIERAICLILDKISEGSEHVYCAIEVIEDVFLLDVKSDGEVKEKIIEEDKDYSSKFSFRSEPVRNTLVSFFDQYILYDKDPTLSLVFYAKAGLANERIDKSFLAANPELDKTISGSYCILKKLVEGSVLTDEDLTVALAIFTKEYLSQYHSRDDGKVGYIEIVNNIDLDSFQSFINSITWIFELDDIDTESLIIDKIKSCEFFDFMCEGKDYNILHELHYVFSKKKTESGLIRRLVSKDKVENIYLKAKQSGSSYLRDSSWELWDKIDTDDVRDIKKKIFDVCPDYNKKRAENYYVKAALAASEESNLGKDYKALKARVYSVCNDVIMEYLDEHSDFDKKKVQQIFSLLESKALDRVKVLEKDYTYNISNEDLVKGIVYSLFNGCYLALDGYE